MIYFTKYSEKKFDILNKHKVFFTKEEIKDIIQNTKAKKEKDNLYIVKKNKIKIIYKKENNIIKVLTFFPTK